MNNNPSLALAAQTNSFTMMPLGPARRQGDSPLLPQAVVHPGVGNDARLQVAEADPRLAQANSSRGFGVRSSPIPIPIPPSGDNITQDNSDGASNSYKEEELNRLMNDSSLFNAVESAISSNKKGENDDKDSVEIVVSVRGIGDGRANPEARSFFDLIDYERAITELNQAGFSYHISLDVIPDPLNPGQNANNDGQRPQQQESNESPELVEAFGSLEL